MEELYKILNAIQDTYFEFVDTVMTYAKKKPERLTAVLDYVKGNSNLTSSDILYFISKQPDFFEDDVMNATSQKARL